MFAVTAAVSVLLALLLAFAAHVRHDDIGNLPTPLVILVLAVAALALRIATA